MTVKRTDRLSQLIKEQAGEIILKEMKDPRIRIGFVTVTGAEVTPDLRQVKIYVSIFGDEKQREECMKALENSKGFFRSELGKRIRMRYTPEVIFKFDKSIEHGARIMELLRELKGDSPDTGDGNPEAAEGEAGE